MVTSYNMCKPQLRNPSKITLHYSKSVDGLIESRKAIIFIGRFSIVKGYSLTPAKGITAQSRSRAMPDTISGCSVPRESWRQHLVPPARISGNVKKIFPIWEAWWHSSRRFDQRLFLSACVSDGGYSVFRLSESLIDTVLLPQYLRLLE